MNSLRRFLCEFFDFGFRRRLGKFRRGKIIFRAFCEEEFLRFLRVFTVRLRFGFAHK